MSTATKMSVLKLERHCEHCGKRSHTMTRDGFAVPLSRGAFIGIVAADALAFCSLACFETWQDAR